MKPVSDEMGKIVADMLIVIDLIRAKHPKAERPDPDGEPPWGRIYGNQKNGKGAKGQIDCPVCKVSKLSYSISGYNGHIHAACATKDCVRFMQ